MTNSPKITREILDLIWDMACSASELGVGPFMTKEYDKLNELNWFFIDYKQDAEWISNLPLEEKVLFVFVIYYSLTDE